MYKTGDMGKWTDDGKIIYIGREDFQVKVRGQRVNLQEIEHVVLEINEITNSIVIDKNKDGEDGEKYLICYYICNDNNINSRYIHDYLKNKLPSYMIPTFYVKIENIPLTSHGKLNRKALPDPDINSISMNNYVPPEKDIEKKLSKIFSQMLNIDESKIGINNSFFELGGTSFTITKLVNKIKNELNLKEISVKDIL
ncbi:hypothetical protein PIROE2DRAFT_35079, partial [Piromyces sp. E2]